MRILKSENIKTISLEELFPIIKEQLESGGTVRLPITGTSMLPLLVWGRDFVDIVKTDCYKKGDIIFYRRDDGRFVLHRIVGKKEHSYILCGDNQWVKEYGIEDRHIIAVVNAIERKGKRFNISKLSYRIYSKIWISVLPFRKYILIISRKIKRLFK